MKLANECARISAIIVKRPFYSCLFSDPASLAFMGQVTEKKTVKWPINNTPRKNTGGGLPY